MAYPRVATEQDILYLNYLFIKEENRVVDIDVPCILEFKMATFLSKIRGSTIFLLSPYSSVFMENVGEEKVQVHIIVGREDRGRVGVKIVKEGIKWYSSLYPVTSILEATIPRDNLKCKIFAVMTGFKKEGETKMLDIPMDIYKMEVK